MYNQNRRGKFTMKITAAVLNEINTDFEFKEIELDEPKANEVRVKLVASGVCHTDAAVKDGTIPVPMPAILGHEGAGIVESVGSSVTGFEPGDHVILGFAFCGKCRFCRSGNPGACEKVGDLNMGGAMIDGTHRLHTENNEDVSVFFGQSSFATYTTVNENNLVKIPNDIDLRMVGSLGCGFMTGSGTVLNSLDPEEGSSLVVFGTGAVGLAGIMAGKIANAAHVIAVDINDDRLAIAKDLGATDTINSMTEDVVEQILKITGGLGAQYALDTTGVPAVIQTALKSLDIKGELATVGVVKGPVEININDDVMVPSRTIKGVIEGDAVPQLFIPKLVDFYRKGQFSIDKLSKLYNFSDIDQAFEDSKNGKTVKPILVIDESYTV